MKNVELPEWGQKLLTDIWTRVERNRQAVEAAEVEADPKAHKMTGLMPDGVSASYRFYNTTNGKGQIVRFCWGVHRNLAGYFLGWREVWLKKSKKDGTLARRDKWCAYKTKKSVISIAYRRSQKMGSKKENA